MVVGAKIQQIASTNIISLGTTTWLAVCLDFMAKDAEAPGTHQTCAVVPAAEILLS
jgi:hypothetical protein